VGPKLQGIQALRGLALTMVVVEHLSITAWVFDLIPIRLTMPFYPGVDLFFVISGYVVTLSLFRNEQVEPLKFLARRGFRLWPAMLAFNFVSAIVYGFIRLLPHSGWADATFLGRRRFLLDSAGTLSGTLINIDATHPLYYFSAMWSLAVEFQFYLAYATVAAVVGSRQMAGRYCAEIIAATVLAICLAYQLLGLIPTDAAMVRLTTLDYLVTWRFDFLLAGCCLAFAQLHKFTLPRIHPIIAIGAFAACLALTSVCGDSLKRGWLIDSVDRPVLLAGFLLVVLAGSQYQWKVPRLLLWLGDRSYSTYLLHLPVMALCWGLCTGVYPSLFYAHPFLWTAVQAAFSIPMTLALADLTFRLIEQPFIRLGQRVIVRRRTLSVIAESLERAAH
jgi:peptidoglycan/LPS O-acetylase OafA/YrhL